MSTTSHSEYGKLSSLFVKKVEDAFISQERLSKQWDKLNYLEMPDFERAQSEYSSFDQIIAAESDEVMYFDKDMSLSLDSIYCRDASIATDFGMIICNMGKSDRLPEPEASRRVYENKDISILGTIEAPGTVEGGDVAWIDRNTLAVGYTYRTNPEGIRQLKALLEPHGVKVLVADLPHHRGPSDVFHLMSILSPVDKNLAVVYSPLMPIKFRNELIDRGYKFVEVPEAEYDSMGCNVLALAPSKCLMVAGNPITKARLEAAGCEVIEYQGQDISVKGGGGPTCLTRPILRQL